MTPSERSRTKAQWRWLGHMPRRYSLMIRFGPQLSLEAALDGDKGLYSVELRPNRWLAAGKKR